MMVSPAPETSWGLLAVDPDVVEQLAVIALHEATLGLVCFDLHNDITEASKGKDFL
jgi:hypothetical protein